MNRIKELRLQKNWKQDDLAERLHTKKNTISRYETEERGIDAKTICLLCDIFDVTADYLLCRSDNPKPAVSEADAALLRAYHAASLRDRSLIDQILLAYADARDSGKNAV